MERPGCRRRGGAAPVSPEGVQPSAGTGAGPEALRVSRQMMEHAGGARPTGPGEGVRPKVGVGGAIKRGGALLREDAPSYCWSGPR